MTKKISSLDEIQSILLQLYKDWNKWAKQETDEWAIEKGQERKKSKSELSWIFDFITWSKSQASVPQAPSPQPSPAPDREEVIEEEREETTWTEPEEEFIFDNKAEDNIPEIEFKFEQVIKDTQEKLSVLQEIISYDINEAQKCFDNQLYKWYAVLCWSIVEWILIEWYDEIFWEWAAKDEFRNFYSIIKWFHEEWIIDENIKEELNNIREIRNIVHPNNHKEQTDIIEEIKNSNILEQIKEIFKFRIDKINYVLDALN